MLETINKNMSPSPLKDEELEHFVIELEGLLEKRSDKLQLEGRMLTTSGNFRRGDRIDPQTYNQCPQVETEVTQERAQAL